MVDQTEQQAALARDALTREQQLQFLDQYNGDRLEIRGGHVVVIREQLLAVVPARTAVDVLAASKGGATIGLLPRNTAFVNYNATQAHFVICVEPNLLPIKATIMRRPLRLAMPWQYFYFHFKRNRPNTQGVAWQMVASHLIWSRNRISSLDDRRTIPALLPNIDQGTGLICYGMTMPASDLPLHERIDNMVEGFFAAESEFNGDLKWNMPRPYIDAMKYDAVSARTTEDLNAAYLKGYAAWAEDSRSNRACFLDWRDWTEPQYDWFRLSRLLPLEENASADPDGITDRDAAQKAITSVRQKGGVAGWR